ncbi:MAG: transcriptional regulator, MarR family [Proteobacteria bacterium]|nr:transcriptional regulator, MarR family [Pseudomonadota bacterium]
MDKTSDGHGAIPAGIYCFEDSLGFLLGRLKGRMAAVLDEELTALDITHAQWVILMRIANGVGRTCGELCRHIAYDTGSMTRMLDRLEEKLLIVRERSAEDRRVVGVSLTEHGLALYPQLQAAGFRVLARMSAGFSKDEVEQVKSQLRRMLSNLDAHEVAA